MDRSEGWSNSNVDGSSVPSPSLSRVENSLAPIESKPADMSGASGGMAVPVSCPAIPTSSLRRWCKEAGDCPNAILEVKGHVRAPETVCPDPCGVRERVASVIWLIGALAGGINFAVHEHGIQGTPSSAILPDHRGEELCRELRTRTLASSKTTHARSSNSGSSSRHSASCIPSQHMSLPAVQGTVSHHLPAFITLASPPKSPTCADAKLFVHFFNASASLDGGLGE